MLDLKRVLGSAKAPERGESVDLTTPWGGSLDPERVLPEHPRPTMVRAGYTMLNGAWDYAIVKVADAQGVPTDGMAKTAKGSSTPEQEPDAPEGNPGAGRAREPAALGPAEAELLVASAPAPEEYDGTILVPFSPEAALSGVGRAVGPDELLWYRTSLVAPALDPCERLVLHFEAVDWACAVRVDGRLAATHTGGYLPFDVDVTPYLRDADGPPVELLVCVYDPGSAGAQLRGKQSLEPGGIWYTAQSGIWQSVWYEVVPALHLTSISLKGAASGRLEVRAEYADARMENAVPVELRVTVLDEAGIVTAEAELPAVGPDEAADTDTLEIAGALEVEEPHLWDPDDPFLYTVRLTLHEADSRHEAGDENAVPEEADVAPDEVQSYCAFRTVEVARDAAGTPRFHLNGEPFFLRGVLDQGYWPDGLLTAPSDEALIFDIQTMRDAGFNMLRKHIKIESARWYYHCDRLGMLVWQDCVSGGGAYNAWTTSRIPTLFSASWSSYRDDTSKHRAGLSANDPAYQREWSDTCSEMVRLLNMHPSIVTWTLFNEGWGQFDAKAADEHVHAIDPTRPIDAASGWYDQRCGDYLSIHNYFRPLDMPVDDAERLCGRAAERGFRAVVLSEFGGLSQPIEGHTFGANAYGYGSYETVDEWRNAVRTALEEAGTLEAEGLSGYVFTQLSDVEDEVNGLVTYDRRVVKLEED